LAPAAGKTAGALAQAVGNAPAHMAEASATPQQRAVYGNTAFDSIGNIARDLGTAGNVAGQSAGKAVGDSLTGIGTDTLRKQEQQRLQDEMVKRYTQVGDLVKQGNYSPTEGGIIERLVSSLGRAQTQSASSPFTPKRSSPPSDIDVKNIFRVLSDESFKYVSDNTDDLKTLAQKIKDQGPPYDPRELEILSKAAGNMDEDHDVDDADIWNDEVLDKYAEYIQNYAYTYKPEAQAVDPSIDPNEEHIGPMAQDIEQVNPACVEETPEGVKTVDTQRLALMNAGAIASLARQMKSIIGDSASPMKNTIGATNG
jgi:hypothetical protein